MEILEATWFIRWETNTHGERQAEPRLASGTRVACMPAWQPYLPAAAGCLTTPRVRGPGKGYSRLAAGRNDLARYTLQSAGLSFPESSFPAYCCQTVPGNKIFFQCVTTGLAWTQRGSKINSLRASFAVRRRHNHPKRAP
ncbi:hypothetical protein VTI74DRAFT_9599 [Chaetomium olivicolor]